MTAEEKENKKSISAAEYIRTTFHSSDRLAVLVRNRSRGETIQRITTSARIVEPAFQEWMHFKNEKESCDIYVGMNTLKPEARTRTKEDIQTIRPGCPGKDSTIESRAVAELHRQHVARQVSGGLESRKYFARASRGSAAGNGAKVRRRSGSYRLDPRTSPTGLSEQEVRHRVSGTSGEAHGARLSSPGFPAPHRPYRE